MNLSRLAGSFFPRPTAMGWAVLILLLLIGTGAAVVGFALFDITGHPPQFSTQ
jgi:hypothetical protein